jgi:DNA phosphorothioation-associated putative methyltransferase
MESFQGDIARHRTAIVRNELSRPVRIAIEDELLVAGRTFFDYGCGKGLDVAHLAAAGFDAGGWDPVHAKKQRLKEADVVNLGYVLNVIEDPDERTEVVQKAWRLARRFLIVAVRLKDEAAGLVGRNFGDGLVTNRSTFQKFYGQRELRSWVEGVIGAPTLPAAPGVLYVFRDVQDLETVRAGRYFRQSEIARLRADELFEEHRAVLAPVLEFAQARGRLPAALELANDSELRDLFGSVRRAAAIVRTAVGGETWASVTERRRDDLRLYLGAAQLDEMPRFGELGVGLQQDVKAFFGSFRTACEEARALLFAAGDSEQREAAALESPIGKLTQSALYVHTSAVGELPLILRAYEACARSFLGVVDGATLVKLVRDEPRVSYLFYPQFERNPHPALAASLRVNLATFDMKLTRYAGRANPPILHRKEVFLTIDDPRRKRFARLTRQEERFGLYESSRGIGTRQAWDALVAERGLTYRGHRLVRAAG